MSKEKTLSVSGGRVAATEAVPLPSGWASAVLSDGCLHAVVWEPSLETLQETLACRFPGAARIAVSSAEAGRILLGYAAGDTVPTRRILALRIAWERVGPFDRAVLRETAKIPYGSTITYGGLAFACGVPMAARAVGGAMSRNPWPVVVPCHRVVGAGGRLVGFGKGIAAKASLLDFEASRLLQGSVPNKRAN